MSKPRKSQAPPTSRRTPPRPGQDPAPEPIDPGRPRSWFHLFAHHHDSACRHLDNVTDHYEKASIQAVLALSQATRGQTRELKFIRQALRGMQCDLHAYLERLQSNQTVRLSLTGRVVPKEGTDPMPAGPFNPTELEDVQFNISPVNAAGQPTSGPFEWTVSDGAAGTLQPAGDGKSCKFVTNPGPIDVVVVCRDPRNNLSDTASVQRVSVDNNPVSMGLGGQTIPKALV